MISRLVRSLAVAGLAIALSAGAATAQTVKVGIIAPFSGPFAIWGSQFQEALEAYAALNGDSVDGKTIEYIYRDSGGPDPAKARALAQELIVDEEVDFLGGFVFTPNALAVAELITEAEMPTVIFNAATSIITEQSPYFVRSSMTLWQVTVPVANWAADNGVESVITAVTDYGPGHDAEAAFIKAFSDKGGEIVDSLRMPLPTTDFAPFIQRVRESGADAVFAFLPAGPPSFAFVKTYNDNNLADEGIRFLGTGETDETSINGMGDVALGIVTAYHYSEVHDSDLNRRFVAQLREANPDARANLGSVGAYDGAHLLYQMITSGETGLGAVEAVKGLSWESPRGPVTIDPDTRHIHQQVYIRRVERDDNGNLVNREFEILPPQPDWGLVLN